MASKADGSPALPAQACSTESLLLRQLALEGFPKEDFFPVVSGSHNVKELVPSIVHASSSRKKVWMKFTMSGASRPQVGRARRPTIPDKSETGQIGNLKTSGESKVP